MIDPAGAAWLITAMASVLLLTPPARQRIDERQAPGPLTASSRGGVHSASLMPGGSRPQVLPRLSGGR